MACSLGFALIHFCLNGIQNEAVQAFALIGGKIFDDLTLALFDDDIDAVVGLFVISGGGFLLGVIIFWMFQKITSDIY